MSTVQIVADVLARKLSDGRHKSQPGYADFDPSVLLPYLIAAVQKLIACFPRFPSDAYEYLTWKPKWGLGLFGLRLSWHRKAVRDRLGEDVKARVFCECLFAAIDSEELRFDHLTSLYAEVR